MALKGRRRGAPAAWIWPAAPPLTFARALPDVLRLVAGRGWAALLLAAAALAAAGVAGWSAPATLAAAAWLLAVEEAAHLAAAARVAPGARLALVARSPLRLAARVPATLPARERVAVALAGPLAAGLAGIATVTLPCLALLALLRLRGGGGMAYDAAAPAIVPAAWLGLSALPLNGTDAAVARDAWRALPPPARREALRLAVRLALHALAPVRASPPGNRGG